MGEAMEELWTHKELAKFLGYSPASVQTMVTKKPASLPPRVAGLGRPRWVPSVVRDWVVAQSTQPAPTQRGRPRRTPTVV
jgi:predicted DNA-binding transcriptional regulator AlpA